MRSWICVSAAQGRALAQDRDAARELTNPSPYGEASIAQGHKHYLRLCQNCHGQDGRALDNIDFESTDLTAPDYFRHGASDGEIFASIKVGAGLDMPAFGSKLEDGQIWEVVNFIRSLGPADARPTKEES